MKKTLTIHECMIWKARSMSECGRGDLLRAREMCSDHECGHLRDRGCAGTNDGREPARDGQKTTGTQEEGQIQIKISWKGQLLFCQNFRKHLSRTSEYIWQKWLKVPGRCGFEYLV